MPQEWQELQIHHTSRRLQHHIKTRPLVPPLGARNAIVSRRRSRTSACSVNYATRLCLRSNGDTSRVASPEKSA